MRSERPFFSVVLSVYNGEATVAKAIQSILSQSFKNFELLLINDGSTDSTSKILETFASKDKRIRLFHQSNCGLTASLNRGLREAQGIYIVRQDADDESLPDRLKTFWLLEQKPILTVSGWKKKVGEKEKSNLSSFLVKTLPTFWIIQLQKFSNFLSHGTYIFKRDEILSLGGYRDHFRYSQDYDLFFRVTEKFSFGIIRKDLYRLRIHPKSISQTTHTDQVLLAFLARILAFERKTRGTDDYTQWASSPEQFVQKKLKQYPLLTWSLLNCHRLRARNFGFQIPDSLHLPRSELRS